jgi:hypothetical protein
MSAITERLLAAQAGQVIYVRSGAGETALSRVGKAVRIGRCTTTHTARTGTIIATVMAIRMD